MKYKRIIFISLLLSLIGLMCLFVFAEKEVLPIITWDKTYGGSSDDWAYSLIQTTDGGYAVAGETSSKGAGEKDFWVIKLDNKGNMIWDRTYGGSNDDSAYSLIQTTDGGYAVAGSTYSKGAGDRDFWVINLDNKGNMIWDRTYGGSDFDRARSLIQTTDGGYAVAGETYSKGAGGVDFWVIKLDYQGNMVWDKTFGGRSHDGAGSLSLIQTTDGGYAVAGDTFSKGAGNVDFWVIKLDHQGNMVWDKTFGGRSYDWARSLIQTTDGGYAVAGETYSKGAGNADFWVIKLDSKGSMIWDKTYGGNGYDAALSLIQTTDGGYAVAGDTSSKGAGDRDLWVIKLDSKGNMIWDRAYGGSDEDRANCLIQTTDGGYAVAGTTSSKGAGSDDFWVIKLESYSVTELPFIPPTPIIPVMPKVTIPVMPKVTIPVMPKVTIPVMPKVTIPVMPKVTIPVMPKVTIPVMPKVTEEVTEPSPTIQSGSLSTGMFLVKKISGGYGELKIENGRDLDALGVISSSREPKIPLIAVYIQSKDSFTIEGIKDDMYTLYFTLGEDWDSDLEKFTRKATYARFEDQLEFKTTETATEINYTIFTVTLHPVIGGAAETKPVSEADFPELN